jgi:hypothetical protein
VAGDLFVDLKCKRKCRPGGSSGNARLRAISHGGEKVFKFEPKGLGVLRVELFK